MIGGEYSKAIIIKCACDVESALPTIWESNLFFLLKLTYTQIQANFHGYSWYPNSSACEIRLDKTKITCQSILFYYFRFLCSSFSLIQSKFISMLAINFGKTKRDSKKSEIMINSVEFIQRISGASLFVLSSNAELWICAGLSSQIIELVCDCVCTIGWKERGKKRGREKKREREEREHFDFYLLTFIFSLFSASEWDCFMIPIYIDRYNWVIRFE